MPGFPYHEVGRPDGWWFLWGVVPIVLLAGLTAAVVVLLTRSRGGVAPVRAAAGLDVPAFPAVPRDAALEALRLRYAMGEVDRDGFLAAVADLARAPGGAGDAVADPPAPPEVSLDDEGPSATDAPT